MKYSTALPTSATSKPVPPRTVCRCRHRDFDHDSDPRARAGGRRRERDGRQEMTTATVSLRPRRFPPEPVNGVKLANRPRSSSSGDGGCLPRWLQHRPAEALTGDVPSHHGKSERLLPAELGARTTGSRRSGTRRRRLTAPRCSMPMARPCPSRPTAVGGVQRADLRRQSNSAPTPRVLRCGSDGPRVEHPPVWARCRSTGPHVAGGAAIVVQM